MGHWQAVDGRPGPLSGTAARPGRAQERPPRLKKYYDELHKVCEVAVYRYYCRNPQCDQGSFTNLPPGLLPYSRYRTETHLLAVQMYAWGYSPIAARAPPWAWPA